MTNLATKSTHKKRKFNKKHIAKKLGNITDKVAKRGVFVAKKSDPGYDVINYITNEKYAENIPFLKTAKSICTTLNDKTVESKPNSSGINRLCNLFYKHLNDINFYKHTIYTSKDLDRKLIAQTRMEESVIILKEVKYQFTIY